MRLFITSFLLLIISSASAQSLFENTYGTLGAEERAFDMVVLDDGSVITAGDRYETSTFERTGYLLKVDADGNEQWNRQLTSNADAYGTSICLLPNGNVFVAGYDEDVPIQDYGILVAEYNGSNGLPIYQETIELNENVKAIDLVATNDNGAIALCEAEISEKTILLIKFDSNGDTTWTKTVNPYTGEESPKEITEVADGFVIVGNVHSGTTDNIFILKTDLNGALLWEEEHASSGIEFGEGLAETPTGQFYIAGLTNAIGNGGFDVLGMKVDEMGQFIWAQGYGRGGNELGYDVDVMPDGGAVFTGTAYKADTSNFRDLVLIRTDSNGDTIWTQFFGHVYKETGYEVRVDGDQIIACRKADVNNSEDVMILRADFDGNTVGIHELPNGLEVNVFPNPTADYLTISHASILHEPIDLSLFDLTGRQVWNSTFKQTNTYDLSALPSGMYLLRLGNERLTSLVISR